MSYNYRSAEKAWLKWKEAEEKELRQLGMAEDAIQQLHTYDWSVFKAERNFRRWQYMSDETSLFTQMFAENFDNVLEGIEIDRMIRILEESDKLTLQMILLRTRGYSSREIAQKMGASELPVNNRISRLKKKIKKFFEA
ncbi:MAG: sigma-70 family RNA polymerase sigma factor [Subdoligranulum sp.]|nr:sigma-70 family RNA polymerase sigma factor [Subdoligranulum sp.]